MSADGLGLTEKGREGPGSGQESASEGQGSSQQKIMSIMNKPEKSSAEAEIEGVGDVDSKNDLIPFESSLEYE